MKKTTNQQSFFFLITATFDVRGEIKGIKQTQREGAGKTFMFHMKRQEKAFYYFTMRQNASFHLFLYVNKHTRPRSVNKDVNGGAMRVPEA